jgi:hypothetical protein
MIRDTKDKLQALMIRYGQYGVALPGGAEAAFHARWAVGAKLRNEESGEWVVVDVDLMNCFGQL